MLQKAERRRIEVRKEAAQIDRIKRGFERKLESRLKRLFTRQFRSAAAGFQAGNTEAVMSGFSGELDSIMRPHYEEVVKTFGQRVLDQRGVKYDFNTLSAQYLRERGAQNVVEIDAYTKRRVAQTIALGIEGGASRRQIAKDIETLGREFSARRSAVIARTETHNASSWANHEMNKEFMPPNSLKQWVATNDARTRSHHSVMNGVQVGIDDQFQMPTGHSMRYPGDYRGGPKNVINCRCVLIYIEPDDQVFDDAPIPQTSPVAPIPQTAPETPKLDFAFKPVSQVEFVSPKESRKIIDDMMAASVKDPRHPTSQRFKGNPNKEWGRSSRFSDEVSVALAACLKDCEELARLFNVPPLRGVRKMTSKTTNATMGDGVMGFNEQSMSARGAIGAAGHFGGLPNSLWKPDHNDWYRSKLGRKWSVSEHREAGFERFRSTVYHEFGHHVHQMYKVDLEKWNDTIGRGRYRGYIPPVESRIDKIKNRMSPSRYGDTNSKEWFAENFAAYFNGNRDIVDPSFVEIIKELIENAY